jgi:protein SCO1/2
LVLVVGARAAEVDPDKVVTELKYDQRLSEHVPLDARFKDETGKDVVLGDFFGKKPVVLTLVYFECPMLCTLSLNEMLKALKLVNFDVGKQFDVVAVSFNPDDKVSVAKAKKDNYATEYGRPGTESGWHFLTGTKPEIDRLVQSVGFHYVYDEKTKQYAHPAGLVVLTSDGRIARYFFDVEYSPKDLRLALVEAAKGKIGKAVDQVLLFCYHYDPKTGRYGLAIMRLLRASGLLTVLILVLFIGRMLMRERRKDRSL